MNGGQGGSVCRVENQKLKLSNAEKSTVENTDEFAPIPNHVQDRVKEAALWLRLNPMTLHPVVTIRRRFALTVIEAAEAAKFAHALSKPEASE